MSGTLRRDCFWMTIIKSNPGDEFYCEGPDNDKLYFNCDNCKWFITQGDMQGIALHIVNLIRDFLPKESKHGRWVKNDNGTYSCSECHSWIPNEQYYYAKYCLYCGAKMDLDEEEE